MSNIIREALRELKESLTTKISRRDNENDFSPFGYRVDFYDDATYIGTASVCGIKDNDPFLYDLEVTPKYRGKGYSKEILQFMIDKYDVSTLYVDKDNDIAINLYKKFNWIIVGDASEDQYIMTRSSSGKLQESRRRISEGRDAPLFHATSPQSFINIINSNTLRVGRNYAKGANVCLTRSLNFASNLKNGTVVVIALDQAALATNYKITPQGDNLNYADIKSARKTGNGNKAEEVLDRDIENIKKYILGVLVYRVTDKYKTELEKVAKENNLDIEFMN